MTQHPRIYHQNDFAYAAGCNGPREIQLGFSNVVFQFTPKEFLDLKQQVARTYEESDDICCKDCRKIVINTPLANMAFRFNYNELSELLSVMRNTEMIMEVERIISLG